MVPIGTSADPSSELPEKVQKQRAFKGYKGKIARRKGSQGGRRGGDGEGGRVPMLGPGAT